MSVKRHIFTAATAMISLFSVVSLAAQPVTVSDPTYYSGAPDFGLPTEYKSAAPLTATVDLTWTSSTGTTRVDYTDTTSHEVVTINSATGTPISGTIMYRSYVDSGVSNPSARPITFVYNGGPGSSAGYLEAASFGPMRIRLNMPDEKRTVFTDADFQSNNPDSVIADTDLVYVNPIGTRGSSAINPSTNKDWWSTDIDGQALAAFIDGYLQAHHRTGSPVYLMGESYGTPRSAVTANIIANQYKGRINLKGITLISSILNSTNITALSGMLPTMAAVAYANHKVNWSALGYNPFNPPDLQSFLAVVTQYADSTIKAEEDASHYPELMSLINDIVIDGGGNLQRGSVQAYYLKGRINEFQLGQGSGRYSSDGLLDASEFVDQISALMKSAPHHPDLVVRDTGKAFGLLIANLLAGNKDMGLNYSPGILAAVGNMTGSSKSLSGGASGWEFSIENGGYSDSNGLPLYLGLYDGRVTSYKAPDPLQSGSDDPAIRAIEPAVEFATRKIEQISGYQLSQYMSSATINDRVIELWDWSHKQPDGAVTLGRNTLNVAPDLRAAMTAFDDLTVLQFGGYYDAVTPYHATEKTYLDTFANDSAGQQMLHRIVSQYDETGHMIYSTPAVGDSAKLKLDIYYLMSGLMV